MYDSVFHGSAVAPSQATAEALAARLAAVRASGTVVSVLPTKAKPSAGAGATMLDLAEKEEVRTWACIVDIGTRTLCARPR